MNSRLILLFVATALSVGAASRVLGQKAASEYLIQHYTDETGLPQNSVKAVARDQHGFVWLSTETGLVRFDGQRFLTFDQASLSTSGNRFGRFVPGIISGGAKDSSGFCALTEKEEYVRILSSGLAVADSSFYHSYLKSLPIKFKEGRHDIPLPSIPRLYDIDPARQHYIAASGKGQFYAWKGTEVAYYEKKNRPVFIARGAFAELFLIGAKPFATNRAGEFLKIHASSVPEKIALDGDILTNPAFAVGRNNGRLYWNSISQKAFLYLNKCFYLLGESRHGTLTTRMILNNFDFDLSAIISVDYDESLDYLFLGSESKGFFVISKKAFRTLKLAMETADNVFYAQTPVTAHSVLTAQGYELGIDPGSGLVFQRQVSPLMERVRYKFMLAVQKDSSFWMGVGFRLTRLGKSGALVLNNVTLKYRANSLYVDRNDKLWVGTENDVLLCLSRSGGEYVPKVFRKAGFGVISIIQEESPGILLIGAESGLYRFAVQSGTLQSIKGFAGTTIRSFYPTADGTWITTYGKGLYLLYNNRLIKFPLDRNGFLATAHCILEDSQGFFWITTNKGLFQVAKRQLMEYVKNRLYPVYYLYRDKKYGFAINEFNGGCAPCAVKLPDGTFSLPSMDGLVWFSPENIRKEIPTNNIFISKVQVDGQSVEPSDQLELSRDFELLRIHVTTPYFGHVNNIQMSYALSGSGRKPIWLPVPEDFVIPLSKISSGKYELTIRKVNGFDANDYTYKRVTVNISPAWYETWWFWFAVIIFFQLVLLFVFRWRTRYLIDKERDANLYRHYRIISQIVAAVNHDIQTPLHYLTYSLRQINEYLHKDNSGNALMARMSDESLNTTLRLSTLTKNLLDYIKLQNKTGSARIDITEVNVLELVADIVKLFSAIADFRNVSIRNEVEPGFIVYGDRNLVSIIVHNLIDNALKISKSVLVISSGMINGSKRLSITDSGDGMPEDLQKWLNTSYNSYEDWLRATPVPGQKGIGLVIVKDLCALLDIELFVSSKAGDGTTVSLEFN